MERVGMKKAKANRNSKENTSSTTATIESKQSKKR